MNKLVGLLAAAAVLGCGTVRRIDHRLASLELAPTGSDLLLTLRPAPGAKINALAKPTLELDDGRLITLEAPGLTPDSAYFSTPPTARLALPERLEGILRVGVCPAGLSVCQTISIPVHETFALP